MKLLTLTQEVISPAKFQGGGLVWTGDRMTELSKLSSPTLKYE